MFFCIPVFSENIKPFLKQELLSGYFFARKETQNIQDDEFSNPGMLWVEKGSYLWTQQPNKNSKSCYQCHGKASHCGAAGGGGV